MQTALNPKGVISQLFPATAVEEKEVIQSLWSGYGKLSRYTLGNNDATVILKWVDAVPSQHPRGWSSEHAHQRKLASYRNEQQFYRHYAPLTNAHCCVPQAYGSGQNTHSNNTTYWLVLEDLKALGYSNTYSQQTVSLPLIKSGLRWLAHFHATFLQINRRHVFPIGSYWHLATRQQEFAAMSDGDLKSMAQFIDGRLNQARYQTVIHGDAKIANFCFRPDNHAASAVDFQYCGSSIGIKDVVYFIGSCLEDDGLFEHEVSLREYYFEHFANACSSYYPDDNWQPIVDEWQALAPYCWADFERFLAGWSPQHKKRGQYADKMTHSILTNIGKSPVSRNC